MYDRECVMTLAASLEYEDEAQWLVEHRHLYFIGLRGTGIRGSAGWAIRDLAGAPV